MPSGPAPRRRLAAGLIVCIVLMAGFSALGVWQVQRLAWKQALIRQVDARIHAAPVPAPGPEKAVSRADDQYRRVEATGRFLSGRDTQVKAVTERGPGSWVMTPLAEDRGFTVLINRGFVPDGGQAAPAEGPARVVGLLRISESRGGFLRANDPARGRWFSRDVAAIARASALEGPTAAYFIDAEASTGEAGWPRGGMTVVRFPNSHLVYAATWFGLALMSAGGAALLLRDARRPGGGRR